MKKIISLRLSLTMVTSAIAMTSCGEEETDTEPPTEAPTAAPEIIPETPYALDCFRINGCDIREYVIVSDTSKGGVMTTAANELQKYIELTCGVKLNIVEGSVPAGTKRILIDGEVKIHTDNDSWGVYTDADGLVLAGTAKRRAEQHCLRGDPIFWRHSAGCRRSCARLHQRCQNCRGCGRKVNEAGMDGTVCAVPL